MFSELLPVSCRGIKSLDKELFHIKVNVKAVKVPVKSIGLIQTKYKSELLNLPRFRNLIEIPEEGSHKLLLLKKHEDLASLSAEFIDLMQQNSWPLQDYPIQLDYDYWTADDILKSVLPDPDKVPGSYEQIGHIAHMNLREEYHPFKSIIGQVILDKSPMVKTVVNKLDTIDSTFRNFKMELLAGEDNMVASVSESGCKFTFDFSKVYWNSRLQNEHHRILTLFHKGDYICDVMAGVGPFSVPAAKNLGCNVWANDLNPSSYSSLLGNIKTNKVSNLIKPSNLDGREFIKSSFETLLKEKGRAFDHVVMNLPASALEFLDAYIGVFHDRYLSKPGFSNSGSPSASQNHSQDGIKPLDSKLSTPGEVLLDLKLPIIHVHCFTKSESPREDILKRASSYLNLPADELENFDKSSTLTYVRKVAPSKDMYCLSFKLPYSVAVYPENNRSNQLNQEDEDYSTSKISTYKRNLEDTETSQEPCKTAKTDI